jgi:antirestriction protein ArdC
MPLTGGMNGKLPKPAPRGNRGGAKTMKDLYSGVTNRILAELEAGAAPWIKPWSAMPGCNHPHNAATGRPYSGCNVVLLWMATQSGNWPTMRYLTFKQALDLGGHVRKGETGTKVYFVKQLQVKDKDAGPDDDNKHKLVPMMREYTVFNIAQCDGLPPKILEPSARAPRNHDVRDMLADEFMMATQADIREGHGQAMYVPSIDAIMMPAFASFKDADNFYSTVFHELGHWTGAKSRLDRSEGMRGRFGDRAYAAEELVAELCAAFLCAEFNMDGDLRHAGYIEHWSALLKADNRAFFTACSKAQAAADHLRELALREQPAELAMAA